MTTIAAQQRAFVGASTRPRARSWVVFGVVCAAGIAADRASKAAAGALLPLGELHHAAGPLFVRRVENPGVALGALPAGALSLAVIGLLLAGLVVIFFTWGTLHPSFGPACALATAGCAGNLGERLQRGYVTDFASVVGLPIFNAADVFIVAGFAVMLATSVIADLREPRPAPNWASRRARKGGPAGASPRPSLGRGMCRTWEGDAIGSGIHRL